MAQDRVIQTGCRQMAKICNRLPRILFSDCVKRHTRQVEGDRMGGITHEDAWILSEIVEIGHARLHWVASDRTAIQPKISLKTFELNRHDVCIVITKRCTGVG